MYKITYLQTICDLNAKMEVFEKTENLPNEILARLNHALALCSHLLDELLYLKPDTTGYFDNRLADLVKRVDLLSISIEEFNSQTVLKYRGITAKIIPCKQGYKCLVVDTYGNDLDWVICANSMPEAVAEVESHFDKAIACLRGFTTIGEFFKRMEA